MQIKFDVFWKKSLGTLYKDISIDVLGKEAIVDLDLREVSNIYVNFKVNDKSFTDLVEIVDIEKSLIRIPFKTDVIKLGTNELELVATMKNGDVKPSQTFAYTVDKSLENPNSVEAETNYPILIELLKEVDNSIKKLDTHWEEKEVEIDEKFKVIDESLKEIVDAEAILNNALEDLKSYKDTTTNELDNDLSQYKTNTTRELKEDFNRYSSEATLNLDEELDSKFTTKSEEITKTLNDEIDKVNASLNSKINEVDEIVEEVELSEQVRKEEHEELVNELSTYADDINNVKDKFNDFEDRIDTLETKITDNEVIVDLKAKVDEHETRLDVLEENEVNNTRIDNLENKVNALEPKVSKNEKDIKNQGVLIDALFDLNETISIKNEEGTIISLSQSDDGKIVIDELQGNTLVNYCKNGSEELTLNNEINVQGTNVTLTDTVDNSKVDVILEGNTLILDEEGNEVEAGTEGARLVSVGELEDNKIEIVSGNSDNTLSNTHSIQLSEPLRGLPNGVCDKFVKQGGKWYVERNSEEFELGSILPMLYSSSDEYPDVLGFYYNIEGSKHYGEMVCSVLPHITTLFPGVVNRNTEGIDVNSGCIKGSIYKNKLTELTREGLREYFNNVNAKLVYQLETPTYEEITDPQLITYLDTTHISTKSTIPCNMQIKNSGYNTIIKPSTLYTVAFDTDNSGEVNVGLGGAKTSTTNGVATITTPSTLTDDTLRLYGKGIKVSNVRLLEGDKTNYIPSYFEGMKSCFEDKLQKDGTYKMEIISNNKNLLDIYNGEIETQNSSSSVIIKDGIITLTTSSSYATRVKYLVDFKIGKKYLLSANFGFNGSLGGTMLIKNLEDEEVLRYSSGSGVRPMKFTAMRTQYYIIFEVYGNNGTFAFSDIILQEDVNGEVEYTPHKSNSIQLQLNEPLRAVGDVEDRFVLKDGKLMIERNCGEIVLNGSEGNKLTTSSGRWLKYTGISDTDNASVFVLYDTPKKTGYNTSICERFTNTYNANPFSSGKIKSFTYTDHPTLNTMYFDYGDNPNVTTKEWLEWLSQNPTTIVYQLAEPTYEEVPFETQKLILECFENGTIFIDTLIPPTVSVTYSANKPVVAKLNQVDNTTNVNTEEIAITQMAVDFLLMSSLGEEMINFKIKGGTNMSAYFASRIIKGALKYEDVISKYPNYKEDIDLILIAEGYSDLIVEL